MTLPSLVAAVAVLALSTHASAECTLSAHSRGASHGGVVAEATDADYELVAKADALSLYVRGHEQPVDLLVLDATVTLVTGRSRQVVALRSAGDRLEATGTFHISAGTKAVVVIAKPGHRATTLRFQLQ